MEQWPLTPSKIGAPGSLNVNSYQGKATPSFKHFILATTDRYHYAVGVVDYKAPASTGGQPRQYCAIAKTVLRLEDGTVSDDVTATSSTAFNDVCQGMVAWDVPNDGAPGTFTQGLHPGLIVTFGNGAPVAAQTGVQYRLLDTDASTPWNAASDAGGATYLTAWQICKAGPDLYAATDAGVARAFGEYRVSKCPAGNNPVLQASWGNGFEVGGPEWSITGLAAIGDSIVAAKPDGLYYYSDLTKRFENVLKHLEIVPHALNGKGMASVTGGVVYPTNDGHAYFFDGVSVVEITPNKFWNVQSRDIGSSRITAICDRGDAIDMFQELGYQTTQNVPANAQGNSILVNTVTSTSTAVSITANVLDGSFNTGGTISGIANGFLDVWATIPFEAVNVYVTRNANTDTAATITSVSYSSATDTFTSDPNGFIDGTRLAKSSTSPSGSFSTVNMPPSASSGLIMGKSPNWAALQQAVTFNYTTGTDVTTAMYGMRIAWTGTFSSTTQIDELEIVPARAGMPNGGIYSTSNNFTARSNSVLVGHVISMKRTGTNTFVPRDKYAVNSFPGVWSMAAYSGRLGQATGGQNLGQSLILWGRYSVTAISESPTRDEIRSRDPLLAQISATTPGPLHQICIDETFDKPDYYKRLTGIYIDTRFVQTADQIELFIQTDDVDIISLGVFYGGPIHLKDLHYEFRYLNLWLGFKQNATTVANAPQWVEPYILEYELGRSIYEQDRATQVPATT